MRTYIKGNYRRSIYQNDNGYHIGLFKVIDTNDEKLADYLDRVITFTGYFHELNDMDTYLFFGQLVYHEKYGEQFQVENYERCKPEEKDAIVDFLTSGLFKGIGEKKAKAIVDVLGKDTLKIILENPDNLLLIPTITKKNISVLHNQLIQYEKSYETILFLSKLGFSTKDSMLIYHHYQDKTREIIDTNIYQLVSDLYSIHFKKIDQIALRAGLKQDAMIRVEAAILYVMEEVSNVYGHSYYFQKEIFSYLPRILQIQIDESIYLQALEELEKNLKIIHQDEKYYLKEMYEAETLIAKRFLLLTKNCEELDFDVSLKIKELESFFQIQYNAEQINAIAASMKNHFFIITGGPGTGKTTILQAIVELYRLCHHFSYENLQEKIALLAPTGRAAKRMGEKTYVKASTIHRFLKWQKDTNTFQVNEYNKSKVELVIIDEASMIDTYLMANLLKGLSVNCRMIIVGDDHQLPSVGPGQILHDLIDSQVLPVIELKNLYRQGKKSNIISFAYDIRNGCIDHQYFNQQEDLTFIEKDLDLVVPTIMELSRTYQDLSDKEFQILAPMYKTLAGIDEINVKLQSIFNPKSEKLKEICIGESIFREGDKVIQLTNMPDENVYNGDIGFIEKIVVSPKKEIHIRFDQNIVKYTPSNFHCFRLAYAISIHKAQGSEFDIVIIPIVKNYNKMLYRKLIYTAVTRSKKKLYLVGNLDALDYAISNDKEDLRRTTIKQFLIHGIK